MIKIQRAKKVNNINLNKIIKKNKKIQSIHQGKKNKINNKSKIN